jgi:ribonuclease HI
LAAERTLAELPTADVTVWTDGSVSADQTNGGAGYVIERADGETTIGAVAAGRHASSYAAEMTAILKATRHVIRIPAPADGRRPEVRICTDSRSALQAIATGPTPHSDSLFAEIWQALAQLASSYRVTLQWVPSHCGISGNEAADEQAAAASHLS